MLIVMTQILQIAKRDGKNHHHNDFPHKALTTTIRNKNNVCPFYLKHVDTKAPSLLSSIRQTSIALSPGAYASELLRASTRAIPSSSSSSSPGSLRHTRCPLPSYSPALAPPSSFLLLSASSSSLSKSPSSSVS